MMIGMSTIRQLRKRAATKAIPRRSGVVSATLLTFVLLGAFAQAQSSITLTWSPSDDGNVAGYRVYWGSSSRTNTDYAHSVDVLEETSYRFTDLTPGVTYYFAVTAYDGDYNESPFSDEVSYKVPSPPPPVAVTFAADSGTIASPFVVGDGFVWQPNASGLANGGSAVYTFTVSNGGNYVVSALIEATKADYSSFFVNIDTAPADPSMIWDIPPTSGLVSRTVSWRGAGSASAPQFAPKVFALSAGEHRLIVRGRGANTKLGTLTIAPYLAITSCTKLPTGNFSIAGIGIANQPYALLAASSLTLPIFWNPIATNNADGQGLITCPDLSATNYPCRFYRLRLNSVNLPSILITNCHSMPGGSFSVAGTASANQTCVLLAASSMSGTVAWTAIATNMADGQGKFDLEDSGAWKYARRFYRVLGR